MTLVFRIFLLDLVLSKAFANPLQQNEPSQQISYDTGVDAFPDTLRELAASPGATANPGNLYATGHSLDQPGSTVTSWLVADSNGSPAAKSNDIWQQALENSQHSITTEITFQYKNEPGDSSGTVCKSNTAARPFRSSFAAKQSKLRSLNLLYVIEVASGTRFFNYSQPCSKPSYIS